MSAGAAGTTAGPAVVSRNPLLGFGKVTQGAAAVLAERAVGAAAVVRADRCAAGVEVDRERLPRLVVLEERAYLQEPGCLG